MVFGIYYMWAVTLLVGEEDNELVSLSEIMIGVETNLGALAEFKAAWLSLKVGDKMVHPTESGMSKTTPFGIGESGSVPKMSVVESAVGGNAVDGWGLGTSRVLACR